MRDYIDFKSSFMTKNRINSCILSVLLNDIRIPCQVVYVNNMDCYVGENVHKSFSFSSSSLFLFWFIPVRCYHQGIFMCIVCTYSITFINVRLLRATLTRATTAMMNQSPFSNYTMYELESLCYMIKWSRLHYLPFLVFRRNVTASKRSDYTKNHVISHYTVIRHANDSLYCAFFYHRTSLAINLLLLNFLN